MSTPPTNPGRDRMITGVIWGAFAILAVVGALGNNRVVSLVCWSLALAVAFALVSLGRRAGAASDDRVTAEPDTTDARPKR